MVPANCVFLSYYFSYTLYFPKKIKEINPDFLIKNGLANKSDLIKVLGRGKLISKINVSSHYFSKSAIKSIEKVGGKIKKLIND